MGSIGRMPRLHKRLFDELRPASEGDTTDKVSIIDEVEAVRLIRPYAFSIHNLKLTIYGHPSYG